MYNWHTIHLKEQSDTLFSIGFAIDTNYAVKKGKAFFCTKTTPTSYTEVIHINSFANISRKKIHVIIFSFNSHCGHNYICCMYN